MKLIKWLRELFWRRCKYCNEKKEWFFYTFETSVYEEGDHIENTLHICTDCAKKYMN